MQKKSKLDAPKNKKKVVQMLAMGSSQADVARGLHVSESQMSKFVKRDEVKGLIEKEALRLLECLPDAIGNVQGLVRGMKQLPSTDHKGRELGYRASLKVLETAGITPVQGQGSNVTTIIQQTNIELSPEADRAFREHVLAEPIIVEADLDD